MKNRLQFSDGVPTWARRMTTRWYKQLAIGWKVCVTVETQARLREMMGQSDDSTLFALTVPTASYERADVYLWDGLVNETAAEEIIVHELRHIHYAMIERAIETWLDALPEDTLTPRQTRHLRKLLGDAEETMIERDLAVYIGGGWVK